MAKPAAFSARRTAAWSRSLARLLTESSNPYDCRAAPWRDDGGPGYIIERRVRSGGHWHFVGWIEDIVADTKGGHSCYGSTLT